MGPELALRLTRACDNIVGIKDTIDVVAHTRRLILEVKGHRPDFAVIAGYDEHLLNTLALGGDGGIPATANFAPQLACGLYRAFRDGDFPTAFAAHRAIAALAPIYEIETPFFAVIKEAIRRTGLDISGAVLPPARPLTPELAARVGEVLKAAGIA